MFTLLSKKAKRTFTWDVKINVPTDNGFKEELLTLVFVEKTQDWINKILKDKSIEEKDMHIVLEVVENWRDVVDENKNPIGFSKESLADLISIPYVLKAISSTYFEVIYGSLAKEKN